MTPKSAQCNLVEASVKASPILRLSSRNLSQLIQTLIFLLAFFIAVYLWLDTRLIYHGYGQSVSYSMCTSHMSVFRDFPPFPGKAAMYIAARLPHYYFYSWAGTLIITAIAGLLCVGTDKFITTLGGRRLRCLRFIPAVFLIAQHSRYFPFLLAENLALLIALLFLYLYTRMTFHRTAWRLIAFAVLSAVMYATAVQLYLVFVLMCVTVEFFKKRSLTTGLLCLLTALLTPYLLNTFLFELKLSEAYGLILSFPSRSDPKESFLVISFLGFFPTLGFAVGILHLFAGKHKDRTIPRRKRKSDRAKSLREEKSPWYRHNSMLIRAMETLTIFIVTAATVWFTCNHDLRRHQRIDYFARHRMWDELLKDAYLLQSGDMFICHDVNRALYHSGRLLDDMFLYPQHYASLLLTPDQTLSGHLLMQFYVKSEKILYELGHINEAENAAYEALSILGYYPQGLMRLAMINIIKRQPDAARTFLNALSKDFLYTDMAKEYLQRLRTDPLLAEDEEIQRKCSFMLTEDSINKTTPLDLFRKNNDNHMAFEYLMAFFLLTGQHGVVAQHIPYLDNFDYPQGQIPRHLAEAILLYTAMTAKKQDLHGRRIDPETTRRFQQFMQQFQLHRQDTQAAANILEKDFYDTYYYFYFFLLDKSEFQE